MIQIQSAQGVISNSKMFNYKWYLKDGYPDKEVEKHNKKVFSTFACGGGSSMGYKLAGYDVIAANDIFGAYLMSIFFVDLIFIYPADVEMLPSVPPPKKIELSKNILN